MKTFPLESAEAPANKVQRPEIDPLPFVGKFVLVDAKTKIWVASTELTVHQFGLFMANSGYRIPKGCMAFRDDEWVLDESIGWGDPGYHQNDDHPVTCVSYEDVQAYLVWLNDILKPNKPYRLLSTDEWVIVASRGANWYSPEGYANCLRRCGEHYSGTAPVASFRANDHGLYDVMGNVWEMTDSKRGTTTVTKGGSWRSHDRTFFNLLAESVIDVSTRSNIVGFRIAIDE